MPQHGVETGVEEDVSVHVAVEMAQIVILEILRHGCEEGEIARIESTHQQGEAQPLKRISPCDTHFASPLLPVLAVGKQHQLDRRIEQRPRLENRLLQRHFDRILWITRLAHLNLCVDECCRDHKQIPRHKTRFGTSLVSLAQIGLPLKRMAIDARHCLSAR